MTEPKKRIVIADDHPILREGLVRIIERDNAFDIVAQTGDGKEALRLIQELRPDIAVLDIAMPSMSGLDVAGAAYEQRLPVEFIILTMFKEEEYFKAALDLGVKGYVLKDGIATELLGSLHAVADGKYYISPGISALLVDLKSKRQSLAKTMPAINDLTQAERNILRLLSGNRTSQEIADALCIAVRTVENHRTNICKKLGIKGYNKLLQFAIENKSFL